MNNTSSISNRRFGDARDWYSGLPCEICRHGLSGSDLPCSGGGADTPEFFCTVRPEVNSAISNELSAYGHTGSDGKLVGQVAYSPEYDGAVEPCHEYVISEIEIPVEEEFVRDIVNAEGGDVVLRDPVVEAFCEYLCSLPRMIFIHPARKKVHCDAAKGGVKCLDCEIELCPLKAGVAQVRKDWQWTIRTEREIVDDVLWRSQRGTCQDFEAKNLECPSCHDWGAISKGSDKNCPTCKGLGMMLDPESELEMEFALDHSSGWSGETMVDLHQPGLDGRMERFLEQESAEAISSWWSADVPEQHSIYELCNGNPDVPVLQVALK